MCAMSDNMINPISSVSIAAVSGMLPKPQGKAPVEEPAVQAKASTKVEGEVLHSSSSNVSVNFRVNDETNELTVFVVDRDSKRVLRTIPVSEFYKMPAGELMKIAA